MVLARDQTWKTDVADESLNPAPPSSSIGSEGVFTGRWLRGGWMDRWIRCGQTCE